LPEPASIAEEPRRRRHLDHRRIDVVLAVGEGDANADRAVPAVRLVDDASPRPEPPGLAEEAARRVQVDGDAAQLRIAVEAPEVRAHEDARRGALPARRLERALRAVERARHLPRERASQGIGGAARGYQGLSAARGAIEEALPEAACARGPRTLL